MTAPSTESVPPPSFRTTYKRTDAESFDEWGWVTDLDGYADEWDEPVELVEETWERTSVRTYWHLPDTFYECQVEDEEPCEENAVAWWRTPDGAWLQVCPTHRERAQNDGSVPS